MVKVSNRKCVLCFDNISVYAFPNLVISLYAKNVFKRKVKYKF